MQKSREYAQLAMPVEVLEEAQISEGDALQMHVKQGEIVIRKLRDVENVACDRSCKSCPCEENCVQNGGKSK